MRRLERALALLALLAPAPVWAQRDTVTVDLANVESIVHDERVLQHLVYTPPDSFGVRGPGTVVFWHPPRSPAFRNLAVRNGTMHQGPFTVAAGDSVTDNVLVAHGGADIRGALAGNLVVLDGNVTVHPGGSVSGDVLALNGEVHADEGRIGGTAQAFGAPLPLQVSSGCTAGSVLCRLAVVASVLLILLVIGLGFTVFARTKFLVVADTVAHSFGRSLLVGFIGQSMILPTFGVLIVGLVLSVVGILLVPFVIVAYIVLVMVALAGGYLAVAQVAGQRYRRQRLPADAPAPPDSFRTVALGLALLATPWLTHALLVWVPVLHVLLWALAFFATWVLVTAGFGAMLLSRGGTRTHFAGGAR